MAVVNDGNDSENCSSFKSRDISKMENRPQKIDRTQALAGSTSEKYGGS